MQQMDASLDSSIALQHSRLRRDAATRHTLPCTRGEERHTYTNRAQKTSKEGCIGLAQGVNNILFVRTACRSAIGICSGICSTAVGKAEKSRAAYLTTCMFSRLQDELEDKRHQRQNRRGRDKRGTRCARACHESTTTQHASKLWPQPELNGEYAATHYHANIRVASQCCWDAVLIHGPDMRTEICGTGCHRTAVG